MGCVAVPVCCQRMGTWLGDLLFACQYRLDRHLALGRRPFTLRRPAVVQRALVVPVFKQALDEAVVAGRSLRPVVAVVEPEVLQPLPLPGRQCHRGDFPSLYQLIHRVLFGQRQLSPVSAHLRPRYYGMIKCHVARSHMAFISGVLA
jgi:hypothetical protein